MIVIHIVSRRVRMRIRAVDWPVGPQFELEEQAEAYGEALHAALVAVGGIAVDWRPNAVLSVCAVREMPQEDMDHEEVNRWLEGMRERADSG